MKQNKASEVVNIYLKCNPYRCRLFLDRVETLPFKRLTQPKLNNTVSGTEDETQGEEEKAEEGEEKTEEGEGRTREEEGDRAHRY